MLEVNKLNHILKQYRENKMAHAYLIETNNQETCLSELLEIIKVISCNDSYSDDCNKCNLCNLIRLNNLPTLKIIEPDGNNIKKFQIQELKDSFSTKPVYSKHNIYVIKNAEKLNSSSANTMLKFLEEPDGQVLGFFITNNKDNILLTIQSRCQNIKAYYDVDCSINNFGLNDEELKKVIMVINNYLYDIEKNKKSVILKNKKIIINELLKIINIEIFFQILLDIYKNALYYKKKINNYFMKYNDFDFIIENDENTLLKKINLIISYIDNLNYNLNMELMLDKFVVEMSGLNE